ncbi:peptidyl-tRNA hydrolase [Corynebacterium kutscheri]|uniref:peptidyl-tRNA hydrolase n=1 Tax=Corynebacterium kutscheri TaxID=35755 RepID=A0A0F6QZN9_9CORY|nr:aminoacyl-tRNA hydrolase [Corynebacterium kutscheri]AKE40830.1 hypothetical protein UL82_03075 [Corynebacterium kutscheri]VEH06542.1 peptidyl-tRNA hydrolase [Corynebacterium kutscheri]VEH09127.1 peptidyl-tRNA hydrolase [Corynebacterium kutscheri]VEH82460.1 peptidyl-tRNA hydrolase [Corynebacterium kutscheri]
MVANNTRDVADLAAIRCAYDRLVTACAQRSWENDPEDKAIPETIQAMQIAMHVPKNDPPASTDILAATAKAVLAVCLDPRAGTDSAYAQALDMWYRHRIRKVARRARNSAWDNVQPLSGVTATHNEAQARAFVPSAVHRIPAELKKLQIRGTDLALASIAPIDTSCPALIVDRGLGMTAGKTAAQVGHASMLLAAQMSWNDVYAWVQQDFFLNVYELDTADFHTYVQRTDAVVVRDAGFTEVAPNSATVCAIAYP